MSREPAAPETLFLRIDGASRGNPGDAGFGVAVEDAEGVSIAARDSLQQRSLGTAYGFLGTASNNVAEYQALIHALDYAIASGARRVEIFSDSQLVVRQMQGQYRVKHPAMVPLHREARALLGRIQRASLHHVPREQNKAADRLANQAVDERDSNYERST